MNTPALLFAEEWGKCTMPHPIYASWRIYQPDNWERMFPELVGKLDRTPHAVVELGKVELEPDRIFVGYVAVEPIWRRHGLCNSALSKLTSLADKHQVFLWGRVEPNRSGRNAATRRQLDRIYRKHGFTVSGRGDMKRRPR